MTLFEAVKDMLIEYKYKLAELTLDIKQDNKTKLIEDYNRLSNLITQMEKLE